MEQIAQATPCIFCRDSSFSLFNGIVTSRLRELKKQPKINPALSITFPPNSTATTKSVLIPFITATPVLAAACVRTRANITGWLRILLTTLDFQPNRCREKSIHGRANTNKPPTKPGKSDSAKQTCFAILASLDGLSTVIWKETEVNLLSFIAWNMRAELNGLSPTLVMYWPALSPCCAACNPGRTWLISPEDLKPIPSFPGSKVAICGARFSSRCTECRTWKFRCWWREANTGSTSPRNNAILKTMEIRADDDIYKNCAINVCETALPLCSHESWAKWPNHAPHSLDLKAVKWSFIRKMRGFCKQMMFVSKMHPLWHVACSKWDNGISTGNFLK